MSAVDIPGDILELGCGYGMSSIYLNDCGYSVVAVDNEPGIVTKAKHHAKQWGASLRIEVADALDLSMYHNSFDLCFSVGVIEHFDRDATVRLLMEQARCARTVIAVIPSGHTKYSAPITDERIYSARQLKWIFHDAGLKNISTFGYGDIPTYPHFLIKHFLPFGFYRFLQNRFSYAMNIGCKGEAGIRKSSQVGSRT
jgi:SAM-dependent methyltransferase